MITSTDAPSNSQTEPMPTPAPAPVGAVAQLEDCVRSHPVATLLAATGLGLVAVLVARALTPEPPKHRAMRLLEDIQHRLTDIAQPAYDRVAGLAEDGAQAFGKGVDSLNGLHLDRKFDRFSRGFKSLFN